MQPLHSRMQILSDLLNTLQHSNSSVLYTVWKVLRSSLWGLLRGKCEEKAEFLLIPRIFT